MIDAKQLRELVIRPTLQYLNPEIPYSKDAENLLMMTAAHESLLGTYLKQVNGPALGIYQMEPATHEDIHNNYVSHRDRLDLLLWTLVGEDDQYLLNVLVCNLKYATAMARVHYYRVPSKLPTREDYPSHNAYVMALAEYAKKYYNTEKGKATVEDYYEAYMEHCQV